MNKTVYVKSQSAREGASSYHRERVLINSECYSIGTFIFSLKRKTKTKTMLVGQRCDLKRVWLLVYESYLRRFWAAAPKGPMTYAFTYRGIFSSVRTSVRPSVRSPPPPREPLKSKSGLRSPNLASKAHIWLQKALAWLQMALAWLQKTLAWLQKAFAILQKA